MLTLLLNPMQFPVSLVQFPPLTPSSHHDVGPPQLASTMAVASGSRHSVAFFFIKGKKYIDKKCLQDKLAVQAGNQQYKWIYIQAKGTNSLEQTLARQACSIESVTTQKEQTPSYDKPKGTDSLEYKKIYINMDSPHVGTVEISKLHSVAAQALLLHVRRTSSSRQGAA